MKEVISEILSEFHQTNPPDMFERAYDIPVDSGKIITLIGPRRSGKSSLFFNLMKKLQGKKVKKNRIIYLNFEDERLNFSGGKLDEILQSYRELYPETKISNCYFFFDEIQNIIGWEKFVRRIYDVYSKNIFITGSNAKLLSTDIATALRGRTISFEILPLSFTEYLHFYKVNVKEKSPETKAKINWLFNEYLLNGGFPELITMEKRWWIKTLQEYFDVMVFRDMIQRYEFTNISVIKYFIKRLAANTCSYLSLNKIYNELRSQGYKLDKNLLYEAFDAVQNIYLAFSINKFDYSVLKQEHSDKKSYFIDNGMLNAVTVKFSHDYGRLLENLCYLELRRRKHKIFYYKNGKECDFVIQQKDEKPTVVQVCYDMNDMETQGREIKSLIYGCKKNDIKQGFIVTGHEAEEKIIEGIKVKTIPALKFLLDKTILDI